MQAKSDTDIGAEVKMQLKFAEKYSGDGVSPLTDFVTDHGRPLLHTKSMLELLHDDYKRIATFLKPENNPQLAL